MAKHPGKCPKCGSRLEFETAVGEQIVCSQCGAALRIPGKAQATDPVDPLLGQKLGQFEILELLGRGGMGAVYKARQASLDRLVAIKVLPESFSHDAKFAERFQREARAAGAVSHAHIIQVFSVGQDRGFPFIAMEFVDGEALGDVLKREGRLPPDRALELLKQTAAALAEAHAAGIVHRDIKPSNILLTAEGVAKVADFGLAKREGVDVSVTQTGTTLGTPLYLPPEAARGEPLDARSDLYSLGATFYHVLAGKPPFEGDTAAALIVKHIEAEVPPLLRAAPDAPPELCKAIHRLLRKRPADRFQSAAELLQALTRVGHPAGERAASPLSPRERARGRDAGSREHPAARPSPRPGPPHPPLSPREEETQPPPVPAGVSRGEATATMPEPAHPSPAERRQTAQARTRRLALIAGGVAAAVLPIALALLLRPRSQVAPPLPPDPGQLPTAGPRTPSTGHRTPVPSASSGWTVYTAWPFDAAEAKRRQEETAKALGVPVEQDVDLGNGVKMTFVLIPAGEFLMGHPETPSIAELGKTYGLPLEWLGFDRPQHPVRISKPFWLAKCEVTQEQWQTVMGNNPSNFAARPQNPVEQVSRDDCQAFLQKLSARLGKTFRLPTEAEWEYACRAGAATEFHFGDGATALGDYAWFSANSGGSTQPVGRKKPNAWGLHDMAGNVAEWCEDWFAPYGKGDQTDPKGPQTGGHHVLRGGVWQFAAGPCRSAARGIAQGAVRWPNLGLRVCLAADPPEQARPTSRRGAAPWKAYTAWPFDEKEAKRRQEETAKALGVGGAQGVDLGSGVKMAFVLIPAGKFLMGSPPRSCRSAARLGLAPGAGWDSLGCRVVLREP